MESSAIARYIPQKSKKRVFPGSSSSRAEPDVIEIAPPSADRTSKSKTKGKQKEVAFHEIIDVDMDEDRNDVVFVEGMVESKKKMEDIMDMLSDPRSEANVNLINVESSKKKDVTMESGNSSKGFVAPGSNNFFDLDNYVFEDDYLALQSHFDNIDLPTGIEAPVPWLTDIVQLKQIAPVNPLVTSLAHLDANSFGTSLSIKKSPVGQSNHKSATFAEAPHIIQYQDMHLFSNSYYAQGGSGTSKPFLHLPEWHKSKRKKCMNLQQLQHHQKLQQLPQHSILQEQVMGKKYMNLNDSFSVMDDMLVGQNTGNSPSPTSPSSSSMVSLDNGDVLKRYESFKKFDTVVDHSDHHYSRQKPAMAQAPKNWAKRIQEEWRILEKNLPDTIYVRAYESRMDLLRAVIIGAEGTPYHDGLFFFDVCFPSSYPNSPPHVHYHSGGLRINPNLYNCGKVCLSLLNTWTGAQTERWAPGTSTMLQVLVSIQGLILNTKPFFNEPGFAHSSGSAHGEKRSLEYNENTLILSLKTMVYTMRRPPKNFEDLVVGHFRNRVRDILMACKAYTEGVQVGCLVKGGVQDVDEANKSCSASFKNNVVSYIQTLVDAFKTVGAKEAEEFLHLSEKKTSLPVSAPTPHAHYAYGLFPFTTPIPAYNHHW